MKLVESKTMAFCLFFLVVISLIFCLAYLSALASEWNPLFDQSAGLSEEDRSNRGQYLNFVLGVPIALIGVAATAFLAFVGNTLVERQAEVQATELADAKVTRELHTFISLINAFDEAIDVGEEIRDVLIPRLIHDCAEKNVRPIHVLQFHDETYDRDGEDFGLNEQGVEPAIIELRRKWAPLFLRVSTTVENDMAEIFNGFQRLTMDPFWSTALAFQIGEPGRRFEGSEVGWAGPLTTIYESMGRPDYAEAVKSPRALGRELRFIAKNTRAWESIHAFLFTPKDATALEFVGAILSLTDRRDAPAAVAYVEGKRENLKREERGDAVKEELKLYNVAAAMLISLYKALPAKTAIEAAVANLFPDAGSSASYEYFRSLPNKRKVTSDAFLEMIDLLYEQPQQLVYSENLVGERPETLRDVDMKKENLSHSFWSKAKKAGDRKNLSKRLQKSRYGARLRPSVPVIQAMLDEAMMLGKRV